MFVSNFGQTLRLLFLAAALVAYIIEAAKPFNCQGGSIYFAAHPADVLLYQNPDVFHDMYVFKCTTTVLFTSGDRGMPGNYSRSIERGFEDAYRWMASDEYPGQDTAWNATDVQLNGQVVELRVLKHSPHVHVIYLRLPNGAPDGGGYSASDDDSLKKLYSGHIQSLHATDGSAMYTLDSLKDLISTILKKRAANDIRVLDFKTPLPENGEKDCEHADHSVSARLVAEVVERDHIKGNLKGYAGGFMRKLGPTLDEFNTRVKGDTYFKYAAFDNHMCNHSQYCAMDAEEGLEKGLPDNDDTQYIDKWLEREYYVR